MDSHFSSTKEAMENFPPNSKKARERETIQRVTSTEAVRRKKSLGRQFSQTFFGGDAHTAWHYMIFNVLIPAAKDTMVEAVSSGIERVVYGEHRPRRIGGPPYLGHVNYRGYSQNKERPEIDLAHTMRTSRSSRARHSFDEVIIPSRQEAEEVIDRLYDLISSYETATVADLYELVGLASSHTDHTWGWTNLRGAAVERLRSGGYLLDLPDPEYLG